LKGYCSGSAQPQLTNAAMDNINVVLPRKEIIVNYNDLVEININQADNLRLQNQKLKESRDILLPKLMNGTIDVE
jgi:type I restriction enzyme S subunit